MLSVTPTIDHARTFARRCLSEGLTCGLGTPQPGQMCVEALLCHVLGLPHSDDPQCVSNVVRRWKIRLNDASHASNEDRAACLVRVGVAQIGSLDIDGVAFSRRVAELTIREILPPLFRGLTTRLPEHAVRLTEAADRCEAEGTEDAANAAYAAANAADAAYAAAFAAADAAYAANAAYAAANAAYAAAYAAADAADAADAKKQDYLQHAANIGELVMREMNAPGIQWLDLLTIEGVVPPMKHVTL